MAFGAIVAAWSNRNWRLSQIAINLIPSILVISFISPWPRSPVPIIPIFSWFKGELLNMENRSDFGVISGALKATVLF